MKNQLQTVCKRVISSKLNYVAEFTNLLQIFGEQFWKNSSGNI